MVVSMETFDLYYFLTLYNNHKKPVVLYGAGSYGRFLAGVLLNENINILFFCDMDVEKHGTLIYEIPVISTEELEKYFGNNDVYIILSVYSSLIGDVVNSIKKFKFYSTDIYITDQNFWLQEVRISKYIRKCYEGIDNIIEGYLDNVFHFTGFICYNNKICRTDYTSPLVNVKNGIRKTEHTRLKNQQAIYFFGNSSVFEEFVDDSATMESYLQILLNNHNLKYNVINYGTPTLPIDVFYHAIYEMRFNPGDIVVLSHLLLLKNLEKDTEGYVEIFFYYINCIAELLKKMDVRFLFVELADISCINNPSNHEKSVLQEKK